MAFFFASRRRHTRCSRDWSSDVCSSDLMSHVDDGTLHAYLDGELSPAEVQGVEAHLAQCPACRGRLDEERALITRAGELLALAGPPDPGLPPVRGGDVEPAPRLWGEVRLPPARGGGRVVG